MKKRSNSFSTNAFIVRPFMDPIPKENLKDMEDYQNILNLIEDKNPEYCSDPDCLKRKKAEYLYQQKLRELELREESKTKKTERKRNKRKLSSVKLEFVPGRYLSEEPEFFSEEVLVDDENTDSPLEELGSSEFSCPVIYHHVDDEGGISVGTKESTFHGSQCICELQICFPKEYLLSTTQN